MDENLKVLYDRYNQCRDQELDRFWKNSTFVWVFIALCFTGYGTIVLNFDNSSSSLIKEYRSFILVFISILGESLSIFWLWMAKCLKAWYKVFEDVIWRMEQVDKQFEQNSTSSNGGNSNKKVDFSQYYLFNYECVEDKLHSKAFSPSKIVIKIGWLLISFWVVALLFGIITFPIVKGWLGKDIILWMLLGICVFPILLTYLFRWFKSFNSSTLRTPKQQKMFEKIQSYLKDKNYYFEVKDDGVYFFFNNDVEKGKTEVKELFDIRPREDEENKLSFKFKDIQDFFDRKTECL